MVTFTLSKPASRCSASGAFSDVWRLTGEDNGDRVFAAKFLRVFDHDTVEEINKTYCKEVVVSKRTNHPNIMSVEGVAPKLFEFCIVSRWMVNGNMKEYIAANPAVNRLKLLIGVTRGLDYLHNNEIVHGYLESSSILIDAGGNPRLHNFRYCWFTKSTNPANVLNPNCPSRWRYLAPELYSNDGIMTNKSDVFSLSMVMVELVTGKVPFPDSTSSEVRDLILEGERPSCPRYVPYYLTGMAAEVWKIAQECWH
ncbi:kinase-like protein [Thelephora ganbajun]|uniref:Kinase-like protein n=1 Tax=Thelephora ganbajun TaxID=370292 RepID=A0ACB6ZBV5_THEGA|nr:kinase-like protein [Thelephora ganbajun]